MTVFHKNTWRPESLETCFFRNYLGIVVSVFQGNPSKFDNTIFYNVKHESVISYWEGEIGKGPRTESWGTPVKIKTSAVMDLNSKYVGRKLRESEGCAGFHNFRSHNKTSKQAKTLANVR